MKPNRLPVWALIVALSLATGAAAAAAAKPPVASRPAALKLPATTGVPAATTPSGDAPFWAGSPSAEQFEKMQQGRLEKARAAIAALVAVEGKRTIENTLAPYDEALNQLDMARAQTDLIQNVHPGEAMRASAERLNQQTSALATEISLDRDVYEALAALDLSGADDETRFYVERELREFRLNGVDKDAATRGRIKTLRDTLVKIGQDWQRNIREGVRTIQVKPEELAGLPQDYIDAHKPGADGLVTLNTTNPDYQPVMTYCASDDVRRRLFMEYMNRGYPKNVDVLQGMLGRRYELADLLGYPNWAEYVMANKMSGNARTVREFIDKIVAVSGPGQERDYQALLARKRKDVPGASGVAYWENGYLQELVRRTDYNFDSQSMRPYLAFDRVEQGILDLTSRLFGVTYRRVKDTPVWHPSVECWEMYDGDQLLGRFYLDMHPRPDKYGHAAEFDIRTGIAGRQVPEAALICNFPGGKPDDPGLCEMSDVLTFFHEFGHLQHALLAGHRRWLGTGGIRTEFDFIEVPSQMLEEWMRNAGILRTFAKHYQTGEPVPADLVSRMLRAQEFAKGLYVRRQMVIADLLLSLYDREPGDADADAMTKDLISRYQPFAFVEGTHQPYAVTHIDGYSAAYYTYMWSLVIAKDLFGAFDPNDLMAPAVARRYRDTILAAGGSAPAAKLVERFLGRPFGFDAYQRWMDRKN